MSDADTRLEIISDPEQVQALQAEWNDLWSRADGLFHQSFGVCWLCWIHVAKPRGRQLRCIVSRADGRLVMVWPLVTYKRALWTLLRPLSPEAADYTSILMEEGPLAAALAAQAWNAATRLCNADIIHLPYVNEQSDLYRLASNPAHLMVTQRRTAPVARLSEEMDWVTFCNTLTKSGKKPGGGRRLAKGKVTARFQPAEDREKNFYLVDWMLEQKRAWASRVGKHGAWLYTQRYRDFLAALLNSPSVGPLARLYVIEFDGTPIAAMLVGFGKSSVNSVFTTFDLRFAKFSPGSLVIEHVVQWALEQRKDFHFGAGSEAYKTYWSRNNALNVSSMQIAPTSWGKFAFRAQNAARNLLSRLSKLRQVLAGQEASPSQETAGRDSIQPAGTKEPAAPMK
jgi:CelD/BcsL family acetyltransferase involved in cellulose biosynthesis